MDAFKGINNIGTDPLAVYRDSRINKLKDTPVFQKALEKAETPAEPAQKNDINRKIQLKKLRDASNELVSFLFFDMMKGMRRTVPKDSLMDGGMAEDIFQEMIDHEYSKSWVSTGRIDLADQIYNQLSKHIR